MTEVFDNSDLLLTTIPEERIFRVQKNLKSKRRKSYYVFMSDNSLGFIYKPRLQYIRGGYTVEYLKLNEYKPSKDIKQKAIPSLFPQNPTNTYTPTNSYTHSSNQSIQTGPKGGKYYINSNGNKTYVPRGKH